MTSTPGGFAVYDAHDRLVEVVPFGRGQEAFELANLLDAEADALEGFARVVAGSARARATERKSP